MGKELVTVTGKVKAEDFGLTLPHEHIIVDFVGADQSGPHRYDPEEVKEVIKPYLEDVKTRGLQSFVECTPMYLARDPEILKSLSEETGLNILTNTGQYKEPFLPAKTFEVEAEELAASWIEESENGIGSTGVFPGFIKTAVEKETLAPIQQKVIKAAALTSKATGLTIATHTGFALPAMQVLDILEGTGVAPEKWIFVHAQNEEDHNALVEVARRGAWISLDGLGPASAEKHLASLKVLLDAGFAESIMLSHDAGWYHVGEERGGIVRPFTYLFDDFLPMAQSAGIDDAVLDRITSVNPGNAYAVGS